MSKCELCGEEVERTACKSLLTPAGRKRMRICRGCLELKVCSACQRILAPGERAFEVLTGEILEGEGFVMGVSSLLCKGCALGFLKEEVGDGE